MLQKDLRHFPLPTCLLTTIDFAFATCFWSPYKQGLVFASAVYQNADIPTLFYSNDPEITQHSTSDSHQQATAPGEGKEGTKSENHPLSHAPTTATIDSELDN